MFSSTLNGVSGDIKIHTISDDSGYYMTGRDTSNIANICKYKISLKYAHLFLYEYRQLLFFKMSAIIANYVNNINNITFIFIKWS